MYRILLILCFGLSLKAASVITPETPNAIIVFGYGDVMSSVLISLGTLLNSGVGTLLKIVILLGFFIAGIRTIIDPRGSLAVSFFKVCIFAMAVNYVFLHANNSDKYRYVVYDKIENTHQIVNNIPIGIGKVLEYTSKIDVVLSEALENNLRVLPNGLNPAMDRFMLSMNSNPFFSYTEYGFGLIPRAKLAMNNFDISYVPNFETNVNYYTQNCFLLDADSAYIRNELKNSDDILGAIYPKTSGALLTPYRTDAGKVEVTNCRELHNKISTQFNNLPSIQNAFILAALGSNKVTGNDLNMIQNLFVDAHGGSRTMLQQIALTNALNKSFAASAVLNGVDIPSAAFGLATAKTQAHNNFFISGQLATEYLPMIKAIVHMIVVGVSVIIALLSIMYMNTAYLKMFATLNIWLILWTPLVIIINHYTNYKIMTMLGKISEQNIPLESIAGLQIVDQGITNAIAYSGSLLWLVPILAYSLASGSTQGFVSFATSLGSSLSSGAMMGARQVASMANSSSAAIATRVGGRNEILNLGADGGISKAYSTMSSDGRSLYVSQNLNNNRSDTDATHKSSAYELNYNKGDGSFANVKLSDGVINAAKTNAENFQKSFIHSELKSIAQTGNRGFISTYVNTYGANSDQVNALTNLSSTSYKLGEQILKGVNKDFSYLEKQALGAAVASSLGGNLSFGTKPLKDAIGSFAEKHGFELAKKFADKLGVDISVGAKGQLKFDYTKEWTDNFQYTLNKNLTNSSEQVKQYQDSYSKAFNILNGDTATLANSIASARMDQRSENYNEAEQFMRSQQVTSSINTNTLTQFLNQNFKNDVEGATQFLNDLSSDIRNGVSSNVWFNTISKSSDLSSDFDESNIKRINPNIPSNNQVAGNFNENKSRIEETESAKQVVIEGEKPENKELKYNSYNTAKEQFEKTSKELEKNNLFNDQRIKEETGKTGHWAQKPTNRFK